jgi:hypothetical protein
MTLTYEANAPDDLQDFALVVLGRVEQETFSVFGAVA